MKKLLFLLLTVLLLGACKHTPKHQPAQITDIEGKPKGRILVIYYSQTGATKQLAEELNKQLRIADIEPIELENPYSGDFNQTLKRVTQEKKSGSLPKLRPLKYNPDDYDLIFIGFPVWYGTYATPIASLLKQVHLDGKIVMPFCTFGSGGLQSSTKDLQKALPHTTFWAGYGVRNARLKAAPAELTHYLIQNAIIAGDVEPEPTYSPQRPLDDKTKAIFQQACGNYPMLHATPITAASRQTENGTDYIYIAKDKTQDGKMANVQVKVTIPEGEKPEFTEVIR